MSDLKKKNSKRKNLRKTKFILPENSKFEDTGLQTPEEPSIPKGSLDNINSQNNNADKIPNNNEDEDEDVTRITKVRTIAKELQKQNKDKGYIVIIYPPEAGLGRKVEVPFNKKIVIGRHPECELPLNIDSVSRRHTEIFMQDGDFLIRDLGSTNGTYLNDLPIKRVRHLKNGDRIRIGTVLLKFLTGDDLEALYHQDVYTLTIMDALTNTYNKRYLMDQLKQSVEFAKRNKFPLSFIMMDIDFFKKLNDNYGHLVGDFVLQELSKRIKSTVRGGEIFARYGGEEFSILLPNAILKDAVELAERVRKIIAETPFEAEGNIIPVTISVGVASIYPHEYENITPEDIISLADKKLYKAKNSGRNNVKY